MKHQQEDLRQYRTWGFTLLQLMGLLVVAGALGGLLLRCY